MCKSVSQDVPALFSFLKDLTKTQIQAAQDGVPQYWAWVTKLQLLCAILQFCEFMFDLKSGETIYCTQ